MCVKPAYSKNFCFYLGILYTNWRRKWQPTPVLLPGKSHGQRSLVGYSPWGHKESDKTKRLHFHFHTHMHTHINWWDNDYELVITVEPVADFILLGSKITADGDCSNEIKRHLLLGGKVMINLDSILKSRNITLPKKVHLVKAMVFPVVMYGCESWTVKKAECRRTDAFELWCWRKLLRVPWTARRSNQSILKVSPGCSLEGLMLKLKLQ